MLRMRFLGLKNEYSFFFMFFELYLVWHVKNPPCSNISRSILMLWRDAKYPPVTKCEESDEVAVKENSLDQFYGWEFLLGE